MCLIVGWDICLYRLAYNNYYNFKLIWYYCYILFLILYYNNCVAYYVKDLALLIKASLTVLKYMKFCLNCWWNFIACCGYSLLKYPFLWQSYFLLSLSVVFRSCDFTSYLRPQVLLYYLITIDYLVVGNLTVPISSAITWYLELAIQKHPYRQHGYRDVSVW